MPSRRLTLTFALLTFFLWYVLWGILDALGGVNRFFGWVSSSIPWLFAYGNGCLPNLSGGCTPVPNWFLLGMAFPIVLLLFVWVLDHLIESLGGAKEDERWKILLEESHQKELIKQAVLDALEEDRRRRKGGEN